MLNLRFCSLLSVIEAGTTKLPEAVAPAANAYTADAIFSTSSSCSSDKLICVRSADTGIETVAP